MLAVAALSASIGIGFLFLVAGLSKLRHRMLLPGVIANYRLLPGWAVEPVATLLPAAEILIGGLLIMGISPMPAILAIALLLLFGGAMAINIVRGRSHIDCGCGRSTLRQPLGWALVLRNLALATLVALRLVPGPDLSAIEIATATAAGLALYLAYLLLSSIGTLIAAPAVAHRR